MKKLYLVDVSSMIFRAFYAIRPLSNPAGLPVNALYGFLSMTIKLMRDVRPDYLGFCFDTGSDTFRKELDPRYKANRSEMPEDLVPQMPYFRRLSEALGICCLDSRGFEADDVIGTLTRIGREHGLEVVIVSGDKDFAQLIRPFVTMYDTMKEVRYDGDGVMAKWGVTPEKFIDYLAIVGDSSDNVPGVAGIGVKGAQKLLSDFQSLEDIYANLDKVASASTVKKLEASKDEAFLSKKLTTIVCDVDLKTAPEDLRLRPIHREELSALLTELDFKTFAKTLLGDPNIATAAAPAPASTAAAPVATSSSPFVRQAPEAMKDAARTIKDATLSETILGSDAGKVDRAVAGGPIERALAAVIQPMSIEVDPIKETRLDLSGLTQWLKPGADTWAIHTDRMSYLAQHNDSSREWTIAEIAATGAELGEMLDSKNLKLKGFDLKDFAKFHKQHNPTVAWDQMLAAYVIRAGNIDNPKPLFNLYSGETLPELPTASNLLAAHLRLEANLRRRLQSVRGEKVLFEIEQPLVPILLKMEQRGILIDTAELKNQSGDLVRDLAQLEKEIHAEAGETFNIGSPKQLGGILFEKMKMPAGKKNKTGYSTDNEVLEKLSGEFPMVAKVLQWRELSKLRSTYVDALGELADSAGRVHTTFNQAVAATGRLSSTNPNLQNIPIRTERGNRVRKAFIAAPGRSLISADYSQIELRVLAHITGDEGLVRAFENNIDIHTATASEVFDVPVKEVTSEMRRKAKAVNFGLAYGQGAFGLAEVLRVSRGEATEIINRYFQRFSGVKTYMTDTVEEAKKVGYVETIFGRRRYLDELFASNGMMRKFGERAAINAPIQGAASDLVKMAMIQVAPKYGEDMLLQVHDELVFEVKSGDVEKAESDLTAKMESAAQLRVPLRVNSGHGPNWLEVKT